MLKMNEKNKPDNKENEKGEFLSMAKILNEFFKAEEILEKKVVGIGNGAHINMPLKHLDKKCRVFVMKPEDESKSTKKQSMQNER